MLNCYRVKMQQQQRAVTWVRAGGCEAFTDDRVSSLVRCEEVRVKILVASTSIREGTGKTRPGGG